MTIHPLNAFFRRGEPIPLTGADFANRYNCDMQDRVAALKALNRGGLIHEITSNNRARIYELTDAGIQYARSVLRIEGPQA